VTETLTPPPTVEALWREVSQALSGGDVRDPGAEARDLIAAVCERPRFWPRLHADSAIEPGLVALAPTAAELRQRGAPFAYAVGKAAFRYLTLRVDPRVLIPRQETEQLVELLLRERARSGAVGGVAADIGTGSGAIALALAAEGRFERVIATDVSADALDVARENAREAEAALRAPLEFRLGAGAAPLLGETLDVLVANPPYIAFSEAAELPRSVRDWEPSHALLSADGGLATTRDIAREAPALLRRGGVLAFEVDSRRAAAVASAVEQTGAFGAICVYRDFTGRDRFVVASRS
jgi:release factor glutamine methyltransferase